MSRRFPMNRFWGLTINLSALFLCFAPDAATIRVDKFFRDPSFQHFFLSPNGDLVAGWSTNEDHHKIFVGQPEISEKRYVVLKIVRDSDAGISRIAWIDADSFYVSYYTSSGDPYFYVVDVREDSDGTLKVDTFNLYNEGWVVDPLPSEEDTVLFALDNLRTGQRDVLKLKLKDVNKPRSIRRRIDMKIRKGIWFGTDHKHRLRLAVRKKRGSFEFVYRDLSDGKWKRFHHIEESLDTFRPIGFLTEETIAVISNIGRDKAAVMEYNLAEQTFGDVLFESPVYDIIDATVDPRGGKLKSVLWVVGGRPAFKYFTVEAENLLAKMQKAMPNRPLFVYDASNDSSRAVVLAASASSPGTFYYFNSRTLVFRELGRINPELGEHVAPSHTVTVESTDGLSIESFLTLPPKEGEPFPLVVMPHGGPIGVREYDMYDPAVQFLADRGFAVLRVNFRGSSGYGKAFQQEGVGQWGKGIEDDINACVDSVSAEYPIDSDKLCILGGSYGGYSALMSVIRYPDKYKCAASAFGVTDVNLILQQTNVEALEETQRELIKVIGDPVLDEIDLESISPFYLAEKISVPVLLTAGKLDRTADYEHSRRLKTAMETLGKPVDYLLYNDAAHGHLDWEGDWHQWIYIERFLRENLNVDYPRTARSDEIYAHEFHIVGDNFIDGERVDRDPAKAAFWLAEAAKLGNEKSKERIEE